MTKNITTNTLLKIIDSLAPLNNELRKEHDVLLKIEKMWELGKVIDLYLKKYKLKLHELLYQMYDPHSTAKISNITRDLGSYSHRIYSKFSNKEEIRKQLPHLKSYAMFREAVPLLFNKKYHAVRREKILAILNSNFSNSEIRSTLLRMKQNINPIKNPRTQKAYLYQKESDLLNILTIKIKEIYISNKNVLDKKKVDKVLGTRNYREKLIMMLLALSNDAFIKRVENLSENNVPNSLIGLLKIARSESINRSRFRKWVLSTNKLLSLAEGIQALDNKDSYDFYRKKHFT